MFLQEPFLFTYSSGDFPILLDLVALQLCVVEKLSCNSGLFEVGFKCIRAQLGNKVFHDDAWQASNQGGMLFILPLRSSNKFKQY